MPNLNPNTSGKECPVTVVYGPSGSGKTRLIGTASEFYKERALKDRTSMIDLSDVLLFQFDKDGLATLQNMGMEPYYYDFSQVPEGKDLMTWIVKINSKIDEAKKLIVEKKIGYVVIDTLSSLASFIESVKVPEAKDPRKGYNAAQTLVNQILLNMGQLPCPQIWLSHSKNIFVEKDESADSKAKKEASLAGDFKTDLGLTYGMAKKLRGHFSAVFYLDADNKTGKRELLTSEDNGLGAYTKNRYPDLFDKREPANLKKLFGKVEAFKKQLEGGTK